MKHHTMQAYGKIKIQSDAFLKHELPHSVTAHFYCSTDMWQHLTNNKTQLYNGLAVSPTFHFPLVQSLFLNYSIRSHGITISLECFHRGNKSTAKTWGGDWSATCPGCFIHKNVQEEIFYPWQWEAVKQWHIPEEWTPQTPNCFLDNSRYGLTYK